MEKEIGVETPESKEQEVQQKLILYQLLQRHLEELKQQTMLLERVFMEIETTRQTISDMKKLKEGNEILIPLGTGFYAHGKVSDAKKVLVDIGSGFVIKKDTKLTDGVFDAKEKEVERASKELQDEITKTVKEMNRLGVELQKMVKKK